MRYITVASSLCGQKQDTLRPDCVYMQLGRRAAEFVTIILELFATWL